MGPEDHELLDALQAYTAATDAVIRAKMKNGGKLQMPAGEKLLAAENSAWQRLGAAKAAACVPG